MVGFAVAMLMGVAVYLRIWSIDSSFTADDREILRFLPPSPLSLCKLHLIILLNYQTTPIYKFQGCA